MADFRIVVVVDPTRAQSGARQVERQLDRTGQAADRTRQLIQRAFTFGAIAFGVRQLIGLADAFTGLQNRLRTVVDDQNVLNATLGRLSAIAATTRTNLDSVVSLYQRGSIAAAELGASNEDLLKFVERVGKGLAIQGGSAASASGALQQLSQSLGSGIVRAEEFNSILEGAFPIAQAAAKGIDRAGGSVARLRQLIITGEVTSEQFFRGFLKGSESLDATFAKTTATVGQAFQVLRDRIVLFLGELDKAGGVSSGFAQAIIALSENLELVTRLAVAASLAFGTVLAVKGIGAAISALRALTVAAALNPFTALATAVVAVVSLLTAFSDKIGVGAGRLANLQDLGMAAFEALSDAVDLFVRFFEDNFGSVADLAENVFGDVELSVEGVLRAAARVVDGVVGFFRGLPGAVRIAFEDLPAALEAVFVRAFNSISRLFTGLMNTIIAGINLVSEAAGLEPIRQLEAFQIEASDRAEAIGARMDEALAAGIESQHAARDALEGILSRAEDIAADRLERERRAREAASVIPDTPVTRRVTADPEFEKILSDLQKEGELLKLSNGEREIRKGVLAAEKSLNRDLTATEVGRLEALLRTNQALADQAALLDELRGPQEDHNRAVRALNALLERGAISQEEFNGKIRDLRIELLETQTDAFSGFERGFLKAQQDMEDFASSSERLITDAFQGAQDAVVEFFETGKFEADDFFRQLASNFLRLGTQQAFASAFGSASGGGLGGLLGGLLGGGGGDAGGGIGGLLGFQHGAADVPVNALSVGRLPGVDNRLVTFRARSDETVSVNRPGEGSRPISVTFNINTPDADSFRRSEGQILARTSAALQRASVRNN